MPTSDYKARQVRAKTNEVIEYDHDASKPGRPLHVMIPGGLTALAALALIVFIGYLTFLEESLSQNLGVILMGVLVPKEPLPVECPFCKRSYKPLEYNFVCPGCGAATPRGLEESQIPGADLTK